MGADERHKQSEDLIDSSVTQWYGSTPGSAESTLLNLHATSGGWGGRGKAQSANSNC